VEFGFDPITVLILSLFVETLNLVTLCLNGVMFNTLKSGANTNDELFL